MNGVFILAASSRPDLIDPALLRPVSRLLSNKRVELISICIWATQPNKKDLKSFKFIKET
jgi:SpoVK/Ycf46/Vps4 family AAA+-type ATPase